MQANDLLNAAKEHMKLPSDYALAKRLGISDKVLPAMRRGERHMPLEMAYKLAIILDRDPAQVIAELEAERAKTTEAQAFWRSFLSRAAVLAVTVACTLAWSFSSGHMAAQDGGFFGIKRRRQCA